MRKRNIIQEGSGKQYNLAVTSFSFLQIQAVAGISPVQHQLTPLILRTSFLGYT